MDGLVNVRDVEALQTTIWENNNYTEDVFDACSRKLRQTNDLLSETEQEEAHTQMLLAKARIREAKALVALRAAQAHLAAVIAGLPESAPALPPAERRVAKCQKEYDAAVKHRKDMERRLEMAERAVAMAQKLVASLTQTFAVNQKEITSVSNRGKQALDKMHRVLSSYERQTSPEIRREYKEWKEEQVDEKKPAEVLDIHRRLRPSYLAMRGLLAELYAKDTAFAAFVDARRKELEEQNIDLYSIEKKIKTNASGRLAEEIVITAFRPYAGDISTQNMTVVDEEGHYTKTDVVVQDLKVPVKLGVGLGAQKGQSIAIEVKAGAPGYLRQQREHILFQTAGHADYNASCVICTRDLYNVSDVGQFRQDVREGGSRLIAMLPKKEELDKVCLDFVKNSGGSKNV